MEVSWTALRGSRSRRPIIGPLRAILDPPTRTGLSSQPAAAERGLRGRSARRWCAAALLILAILVTSLARDTGPSRFRLASVAFAQLEGWEDDKLSAAIPV